MVGQDIQKHNPGSIDEGYDTRVSTPTNFEDGAIDEPEDEGTSDHNVPNKTPIDERYPSFYRCFTNEPEDESDRNILNKAFIEDDKDTPDHTLNETFIIEEDELKDLEVMSELQLDGAIYEQVDERMKENISNVLEAIYRAFRLYSERRLTVGQMIEK